MTTQSGQRNFLRSRSVYPYALGVVGAALIGLASSHLVVIVVGLATLLPGLAQIRHVGVRRALTEPSLVTIIVLFYFFVFPLRGLVIANSGYTDVYLARAAVSSSQLVPLLLLASIGTTVLVESYYLALREPRGTRPLIQSSWAIDPLPASVIRLATLLACLAVGGLLGVLFRYGGLGGAQAALLSHSTANALAGQTSFSGSTWQVFAVPAVWCAACVALNRATTHTVRLAFAGVGISIVVSALVIYGSRLTVILAAIGTWVVFHQSGRRLPLRVIAVVIPAAVLLSNPLLSARNPGQTSGVSTLERYSRISSYGVLDSSLGVWNQPALVRAKLLEPQRWLNLPGYFVPSFLWHGRPNINAVRLGLYVAQTVGGPNDQNTGFPTTYLTEWWLIGGWPGVVVFSILVGLLLGWTQRKLLGALKPVTVGRLLPYCFIAALAFSYYKDGDILTTSVGEFRGAVYLSLLLVVTGVWLPTRRARRAADDLARATPHLPRSLVDSNPAAS